MRIAFVSTMSAAPWGGSEELWSRTALAALEQNHNVLVSVPGWKTLAPPLERLRSHGAEMHLRPLYTPELMTRISRRIQSKLGIMKSLVPALKAFTPDFICVNQGGNFDLVQMDWLRNYLLNCGTPFCIVCHNYDASHLPVTRERWAAKQAFEGARRVFFVAGDQIQVTQRQLASTIANAEIVKNPVNLSHAALLDWPTSSVPQLAIVAGLDIDRKGHDIALDVLRQEKWRCRQWHLNIYGDGPDQSYIEELILYHELSGRVTMHGNTDELIELWRLNHLLLVPSRRDAAPLVIMEAMLSGRPVVATAVGTVLDWITPGETGFIALAPTVSLFDEALEQAFQSQVSWQEIGNRAYEWAHANADPHAPLTFLNRLLTLADTKDSLQK